MAGFFLPPMIPFSSRARSPLGTGASANAKWPPGRRSPPRRRTSSTCCPWRPSGCCPGAWR
eukprot:1827584-Pyramimonas_sp.AAC.1